MMSTNVRVDTATAAARRLRSWLRHERMTVAMTLAEKLHHTSRGQKFARVGEEVVHHAHDAPRGPKTPPPGERPGILPEPVPQRSDRTVRRFAGAALPTLALPVLAGSAGEAVDTRTLPFLTAKALEDRKKTLAEEAAARVELRSLLAVPRSRRTAEQESRLDAVSRLPAAAPRRKRKKKRKKRLPKSSARHPPSSSIRTGKSGHYSTSPSFWQSPVRCPGVACGALPEGENHRVRLKGVFVEQGGEVRVASVCSELIRDVRDMITGFLKNNRMELPTGRRNNIGVGCLRAGPGFH